MKQRMTSAKESTGRGKKVPHIHVKRIAWDGWEAVVEGCPLIRARGGSAVVAVEVVLAQLRGLDDGKSKE